MDLGLIDYYNVNFDQSNEPAILPEESKTDIKLEHEELIYFWIEANWTRKSGTNACNLEVHSQQSENNWTSGQTQ